MFGPDIPGRSGAFRADARSVSPVIGVVLMLAVGILLVGVLQATAIPALNAQLEFEHNQKAQADVVELASAIDRTAALGDGETATVDLGLRYPPRLLFVNPPPASGSLRTTDPETVRIENARATGETGDYWDGSPRTLETRRIVYTPGYHEYDGAPTTVHEPWAVYNRITDRTLPKTDSDLVDGRRISLVAIDGEYDAAAADAVGVDVAPTSAPARTVTVRDDGEPIRVTVPTELRRDAWEDLLADELDPSGTADGRYVTDISCQRAPPAPCGELTLTLERGSYEVRLGEVAVGSGASREPATYLTDVEGKAATVPETSRQRLVVEARDRYDNPVGGVPVTATLTGGPGTVLPASATTDGDGRATFVYEAPQDVNRTTTAEVEVRFGDGSPQRTVPFEVLVTDRGAGAAPAADPLTVEWTAPSSGEDDAYTFDAGGDNTVPLTVTTRPSVEGVSVEYVVSDPSVGTVSPTSGTSDAAGSDTITFTANGEGVVTVYAIGGGDADVMSITVTNLTRNSPPSASFGYSPSAPATGQTVSFDGTGSTDADGSIVSYEWNFGDGTTATGPTPSHAYASPGTYSVSLTVTDDGGATDTVTRSVTVNDPPSIDSLTVTDTSKTTGSPKYAQFVVDYAVSDDVQLDSIRFTVVRQSDGARIIDTTTALSGTSASGSETIREPD